MMTPDLRDVSNTPAPVGTKGARRGPLRVLAAVLYVVVCLGLLGWNLRWWWVHQRVLPELTSLEALLRHGRYAEAEPALRDWVARSPHDGRVRMMLARCRAGRGDLAGCAEQLIAVPVWWPERIEAVYRAGEALYQLGRAREAEAVWLEVLKDDPLHPSPLDYFSDAGLKIITLRILQERIDEAKELLALALSRADNPADRTTLLGMRMRLEFQRIDPNEKITTLTPFVEADPNDWDSWLGLAIAYDARGDNARARELYERCLHGHPRPDRVRRFLLEGLVQREAWDELRTRLEPLDVYPPNLNEAIEASARGRLALQDGRDDLAEAMFRRAIELDPRDAESHYRLGLLLKRRGILQDALGFIRRSQEINDARSELDQAYNEFAFAVAETQRDLPNRPDLIRRMIQACRILQFDQEADAWRDLLGPEPAPAWRIFDSEPSQVSNKPVISS